MVAFKLTFLVSAAIFSLVSQTYAAPSIYTAGIEARSLDNDYEYILARDVQDSTIPPGPASTMQSEASAFGSALKSHTKDNNVLAVGHHAQNRRKPQKKTINVLYMGHHAQDRRRAKKYVKQRQQGHHVPSNTADGTTTFKPVKPALAANSDNVNDLDSNQSRPGLNQ